MNFSHLGKEGRTIMPKKLRGYSKLGGGVALFHWEQESGKLFFAGCPAS